MNSIIKQKWSPQEVLLQVGGKVWRQIKHHPSSRGYCKWPEIHEKQDNSLSWWMPVLTCLLCTLMSLWSKEDKPLSNSCVPTCLAATINPFPLSCSCFYCYFFSTSNSRVILTLSAAKYYLQQYLQLLPGKWVFMSVLVFFKWLLFLQMSWCVLVITV